MPTENQVMNALSKVMDPELHRSLVELNMVRDLKVEDGTVNFTLVLTVPTCPMRNQMANNARTELMALSGVRDVNIRFAAMTEEERRALMGGSRELPKLAQFNIVKNIVAVMSGKGGVGKSSITALLATELAAKGFKVGILDADITGPSIPKLFGLPSGGLRGGDQGMLPAVTSRGIKVVSSNLLLKTDDLPIVWRGPMISGTIQKFWSETLWGRLDYLLVDLPPGTSDPALAVMRDLPLTGIILVTTPQDLAALVVRKAIHMANDLKVPILGIVENMSYFRCPSCDQKHEIFGPSHVDEISQATGVQVSARLPVNPAVATLSDEGRVEEVHVAELNSLVEQLPIIIQQAVSGQK
jgi:ATP-binding protein involved in chromosome partitioning